MSDRQEVQPYDSHHPNCVIPRLGWQLLLKEDGGEQCFQNKGGPFGLLAHRT